MSYILRDSGGGGGPAPAALGPGGGGLVEGEEGGDVGEAAGMTKGQPRAHPVLICLSTTFPEI